MLQLNQRPIEGVLTLEVRGDVDSASADELRNALRRVPPGIHLVVDLRAVPFMDSAGLGALICGYRELRFAGAVVAVCVGRNGVQRLLSITGFDRMVPTLTSPEQARRAIWESPEVAAASGAPIPVP